MLFLSNSKVLDDLPDLVDPDSGDTSSDDDNGTCIPDLVDMDDEDSTDSTHDDSEVKARIICGCLLYLPYGPWDSKMGMTTSMRFSHYIVLVREPVSFWQEIVVAVINLLRVLAQMSCWQKQDIKS